MLKKNMILTLKGRADQDTRRSTVRHTLFRGPYRWLQGLLQWGVSVGEGIGLDAEYKGKRDFIAKEQVGAGGEAAARKRQKEGRILAKPTHQDSLLPCLRII